MSTFLQDFENHFRDGFKQDLQSLLKKLQGEKIYACAIFTDSDWVTLGLAVNTEEALNRHIEDMKEELQDDDEGEYEDDEYSYFRWACGEFQYDSGDFNNISKLMNTTKNVHEHSDDIVKIIAKVVNETDGSLFAQFGQSKEDTTFFVSLSDDDGAEELENQSVVLMTTPKLSGEFLKRYDED
jgi:hypothetical protein